MSSEVDRKKETTSSSSVTTTVNAPARESKQTSSPSSVREILGDKQSLPTGAEYNNMDDDRDNKEQEEEEEAFLVVLTACHGFCLREEMEEEMVSIRRPCVSVFV